MAYSKKTEGIDFEKELVRNLYVDYNDSYLVHRRISTNLEVPDLIWGNTYCNSKMRDISYFYKKGTQYSDICKKCLKSYSIEEIKLLKHFLIVQKLMGK